MHCPNCGHELPEGASFCTNCGSSIDAIKTTPNEPQTVNETPEPQAASEAAPASPKNNAGGWQNSMAFRIATLVIGIALIVMGVIKIAGGLGCSNKQASTTAQTSAQTSTQASAIESSSSSSTSTAAKFDESLCTTSEGYLTIYGLIELDGKQLMEVFDKYDYDSITNNGKTLLTPSYQHYALMAEALDSSKYLSFDEVKKLDVGGKGQAIDYIVVTDSSKTVEGALKKVGNVEIIDQITDDDGMFVGVVKNTAGDSFLLLAIAQDNTVALYVYNQDYITKGGFDTLGSTPEEILKNYKKNLGTSDSKSFGLQDSDAQGLLE